MFSDDQKWHSFNSATEELWHFEGEPQPQQRTSSERRAPAADPADGAWLPALGNRIETQEKPGEPWCPGTVVEVYKELDCERSRHASTPG